MLSPRSYQCQAENLQLDRKRLANEPGFDQTSLREAFSVLAGLLNLSEHFISVRMMFFNKAE